MRAKPRKRRNALPSDLPRYTARSMRRKFHNVETWVAQAAETASGRPTTSKNSASAALLTTIPVPPAIAKPSARPRGEASAVRVRPSACSSWASRRPVFAPRRGVRRSSSTVRMSGAYEKATRVVGLGAGRSAPRREARPGATHVRRTANTPPMSRDPWVSQREGTSEAARRSTLVDGRERRAELPARTVETASSCGSTRSARVRRPVRSSRATMPGAWCRCGSITTTQSSPGPDWRLVRCGAAERSAPAASRAVDHSRSGDDCGASTT